MEQDVDHTQFQVTLPLFREWQTPRFGRSNPERMDNKVWEWLICSQKSAYQAKQEMGEPCGIDQPPTWSFDRFGQTSTELPDGRVVLIGGEHEDHYDPDFCIYNDVVVKDAEGTIAIYGYPEEVFPPTDFHSATFTRRGIVLIGSLGYPWKRVPGETQVCLLDPATFEIQRITTSGTAPGWIHEHTATLAEDGDSITIAKGLLDRGGESSLVENIDDWRLDLSDWSWKRLSERKWSRWKVSRRDGNFLHLWEMRQALWKREMNQNGHLLKIMSELAESGRDSDLELLEERFDPDMSELTKALGREPDLDLFEQRFSPDLPHEKLPDNEDEHGVFRIRVDGVVVRYVEGLRDVQVTVEGSLPEEWIDRLKSDLAQKLSILENSVCEIEAI